MTQLEQAILEKVRALPAEKQRELLDFAEFLEHKTEVRRPRRKLLGALAHLNLTISAEDIAEARREMWGNFPRDIEL